MRLNRPPIVEAWIEFHLQAAEQEDTWPRNLEAFLDSLKADFPEREFLVRERVDIISRLPSGLPKEITGEQHLERARAFDQSRTRCVQVGESILVYNLAKRGADYPGFDELLSQSLDYRDIYTRLFRPQAVREAILHYTDLIKLPVECDSTVRIEDYLNIGVRVPDENRWRPAAFASQCSIPLESRTPFPGHLTVRVQSTPMDPAARAVAVRIDWHAVSGDLGGLTRAQIAERIACLRDATFGFFREAATERLWSMFDPVMGV